MRVGHGGRPPTALGPCLAPPMRHTPPSARRGDRRSARTRVCALNLASRKGTGAHCEKPMSLFGALQIVTLNRGSETSGRYKTIILATGRACRLRRPIHLGRRLHAVDSTFLLRACGGGHRRIQYRARSPYAPPYVHERQRFDWAMCVNAATSKMPHRP